jgi:hypothetical protein
MNTRPQKVMSMTMLTSTNMSIPTGRANIMATSTVIHIHTRIHILIRTSRILILNSAEPSRCAETFSPKTIVLPSATAASSAPEDCWC